MSSPAYLQLYEKLRKEIVSGALPYGAKLPGKRALAEQHGVSVITVAHALEMLSDEGYLALRERSGCYVAFRGADAWQGSGLHSDPARTQNSSRMNTFPASLNAAAPFSPATAPLPVPGFENPLSPVYAESPLLPISGEKRSSADVEGFPLTVLAKAMRRVLAEQGDALLQKSPNQGLPSLRSALSRYLARSRNILAGPEQIILGAGAEYLYGLLVDMLGGDRPWAIEFPSYEQIERVYSARGVLAERLPLGRDGIQSVALWASLAAVLHVSPYRSYPSDVTASASKRAEYLRWADEKNRLLIEDDFESEFSIQRKPMDTLFSQAARENVIYLNTFSRTISPALRAGYMVLPKSLIPLYQDRAGFYSCAVPTFEQLVLTTLIDSGDFERHIRRVRRKLKTVR